MATLRSALRDFGRPPRLLGVDAARGLAVIGMIGAHVGATGWLDWSDPSTWAGLVDGRSSILFALVAGVSIALLSGGAERPTGEALKTARLRMAGRALVVMAIGLLLELLGTDIAVILPLYAVLFIIAIPLLGVRRRTLVGWAVGVALVGPTLVAVVRGLTLGARGEGIDFLLIGAYPLAVWLSVMLAGMVIGRSDLRSLATAGWMLWSGALLALGGYSTGAIVAAVFGLEKQWGPPGLPGSDSGVRVELEGDYLEKLAASGWWYDVPAAAWGVEPHSGGTFEIIGSGGFAIGVLGLCLLLAKPLFWLLVPIAGIGRMPLTAYTLHVVSYAVLITPFALAPELKGKDDVLGGNLLWTVSVVVLAIGCTWWAAARGRGPLERVAAWAGARVAG